MIKDITEKEIIELFNTRFGNKLTPNRFKALDEEIQEALEVYVELEKIDFDEKGNTYLHLQDEVKDFYSIALHILHCVGLTHQDAMNSTYEKIITRDTNPNFKKEW